ncbi:HNH endonuclease signature motif containing protein [Microlunatus panaciterrae]|uniref:HNH nuclease domain-containing protein n=1 Tax=Microlunatus panaciterrae TaxID=400768 RepID=A0ABS2RMY6_9ACTN|nr:HNH endonuclease signature motif containing protein [Microlunatus panaciterrae]MBM7800369.1 hypothetical protein [Microlunatus panaciterrae]
MELLDQLDRVLADLIALAESGGLQNLNDESLAEFGQDFERVRNRLALVDHQLIAECDQRGLGRRWLQRDTAGLLSQLLSVSSGEARNRVRAAEALRPRSTLQGDPLPPNRPVLSDLLRSGRLNPEQRTTAIDTLELLERAGLDPTEVSAAEQTLTDLSGQLVPKDFRKAASKLVEVLLPDGRLDDIAHSNLRDFWLRPNRDGSFTPGGRVTPGLGAKLFAVLSPLAAPRPTDADGPDPRSAGQRLHDALEDVASRLLRAGGLPDSGGTPATVVVMIDVEKLLARCGHGETSDGTLLPVSEVLKLANEAEIIPAAFTRSGLPLDLGRDRRIANKNQTLALMARDGGCSFPGCSAPPEWCERHHVRSWLDGGRTEVNNLTLLCGYHHREFADRGWSCVMINKLPAWVPPRWRDPAQRPLVHHRIRQRFGLAA